MKSNFFVNANASAKSFDFSPWGGIEGFLDASKTGKLGNNSALKQFLPWLARAQDMTSNAISILPFRIISDDGDEVDSSEDWHNKMGGIAHPKRLLKLIAASLCGGAAYLLPTYTEKMIADIQYLAPSTITPIISDAGLDGFIRTVNGAEKKYASDELVYFWLPDSDVEVGPAHVSPLGTAAISARLLLAMDSTLEAYGERGFVPATLLAAKGMTNPGERDKAENWWNRFLRGWTNTVAKIINSEALSVQRVGAGLDELRGVYLEITKQAIENIGAAYGIPAGMFMASAAYATEMDALIRQWYETSQFVAIYTTIADTMTEQVFSRFGMRWVFLPETLDAFQTDEASRSANYSTYVGAGIKPSIAAQIVGLVLPEGVTLEELDKPVNNEPPPPTEPPQNPTRALNHETINEINLWRQMAERSFKKTKPLPVNFECKHIPDEMAAQIRHQLSHAKSMDDVLTAFVFTVSDSDSRPADGNPVAALAQAINRAVESITK